MSQDAYGRRQVGERRRGTPAVSGSMPASVPVSPPGALVSPPTVVTASPGAQGVGLDAGVTQRSTWRSIAGSLSSPPSGQDETLPAQADAPEADTNPDPDAYFHSLYADRELYQALRSLEPPQKPALWPATTELPSGWNEVADKQIQAEESPEAKAWRKSQIERLQDDYRHFRAERYEESFEDFNLWRRKRNAALNTAAKTTLRLQSTQQREPED